MKFIVLLPCSRYTSLCNLGSFHSPLFVSYLCYMQINLAHFKTYAAQHDTFLLSILPIPKCTGYFHSSIINNTTISMSCGLRKTCQYTNLLAYRVFTFFIFVATTKQLPKVPVQIYSLLVAGKFPSLRSCKHTLNTFSKEGSLLSISCLMTKAIKSNNPKINASTLLIIRIRCHC